MRDKKNLRSKRLSHMMLKSDEVCVGVLNIPRRDLKLSTKHIKISIAKTKQPKNASAANKNRGK
jgi:hypothetical protein